MKALRLPLAIIVLIAVLAPCHAQEPTPAPPEAAPEKTQDAPKAPPEPAPAGTQNASVTPGDSTLENTIDASESSIDAEPQRKFVRWNEYKGPYFTVRFGLGFLYELAAYAQDEESKEQIAVLPDEKIRDFRFLLGGSFPKLKRPVTWSAGIMYDAPNNTWLIRQTGIMVGFPELLGYFFIGRTKIGFSLNKVMTGYDGWTMERATMNDATVPLLADGIKWLGYSRKHGFLWNLGYYNDFVSYGQSFSSYSSEEVARLAWLPIHSEEPDKSTLLHLGVNLFYGTPVDGKLQLRSRPEAFPAPYFVDTGQFAASATRMAGYEAYYRRGPWLFGSEYWFQSVSSPSKHDPLFQGGDVAVVSWLITGETRTYNTVGGFFRAVSPARPVFDGGRGAWELVFRYSYIDLDGGTVRGGKFGRFTPMVNWYLSQNVRLEFTYGYGHLDRFDLRGNTQFFQSRVQFQF